MIDENSLITCQLLKDDRNIRDEWEKIFTFHINDNTKRKIYYDDFRWHLFSNHILEAKEGDEARKCFDQSLKKKIYESYRKGQKSKLYAFYQNEYGMYEIEISEHLQAKYFDMECDIYIFDPEDKWTYINTHEGDWFGPYYYQL